MAEGIMWGVGVVAMIPVMLRFYARIKRFKRLYWDDFFVFIAVIFDIIIVIIWQTSVVYDLYEVMNTLKGFQSPGPDFAAHGRRYFILSIVVLTFFISTLWAIKFSFLIFFRRLGKNVRRQRLLWWPIFGFTAISYLVALVLNSYQCLGKSLINIFQKCGTKRALTLNGINVITCSVLDILTDLASKQSFVIPHFSHRRIWADICV